MSLNAAQMTKLVDDWWQNDIQETDEFTHSFYKACQAEPEQNAGVNGAKVKVRTAYNASESTAGANGATVATGGSSTFQNLYVPYRFYTKTCLFTKEALDNDDSKSHYHPMVQELASARLEGMKAINRHFLLGDGLGTIAVASGVDSGQDIPFAPNTTNGGKGAQFMRPGKIVQIYASDGTTQRVGGGANKITVASVVLSTGVVTFTGTVPTDAVSTDLAIAEGSSGEGIAGLEYMVKNTGSYYELSRTTYPGLQSKLVDGSSGSLLLLVEDLFAELAFYIGADVALGLKGESKSTGWWSPTQRQAYRGDSLGLGITMLGGSLDAGYAHKEEINGMSFTCEPDHSNTKIHFLKMDKFRRIVRGNAEKPLSILPGTNGQSVYPLVDAANGYPTTTMATTLCGYLNLHSVDLRCQAAIYSLPTSGLATGN